MPVEPDLVGVFVTDSSLGAISGYDIDRYQPNSTDLNVKSMMSSELAIPKVDLTHHASPADAFDELARLLSKLVPGLRAVCIGSYGPFEPTKDDTSSFGVVRNLRRSRAMEGVDVRQSMQKSLAKCGLHPDQIYLATDASCAAVGEKFLRDSNDGIWYPAARKKVLAYLKASVGIGGAFTNPVEAFNGHLHSEMGQIIVNRWLDPVNDPNNDEANFYGVGQFPERLEGLASVPAMEKRYNASFSELLSKPNHPVWLREAYYLAQLCQTVTSVTAPSQIVLGGRIMSAPGMLNKLRNKFKMINGPKPYPDYPDVRKPEFLDVDSTISRKRLDAPGALGALLLAAIRSREPRPPAPIK